MAAGEDLRKLYAAARSGGLLGAGRLAWQAALMRSGLWSDRRFDRRHGVQTTELARLDQLDIASSNRGQGTSYYPTPVRVLEWILRRLPETEGFNFIDLGSGRGRALLVAARYPFRQIIGVEFARELHDSAAANIHAFRLQGHRGPEIVTVHGDASRFAIPPGPCVFYLFAPFRRELMAQVLANIEQEFRQRPRPMYLVYARTWYADLLAGQAWLQLLSAATPWWLPVPTGDLEVRIYRARPPAGGAARTAPAPPTA